MATSDSSKLTLLDQLAEEFAQRYRQGERPLVQEYCARHPNLADELRELLPAMIQMEQVKDGRSDREAAGALQQMGDYRIVREIGRGGMGIVYEAEQLSLGRRVALKLLPLQASRDGKALERFRREARAAAKLHHTNIVPVFEVGQAGETCYYAMQFIQGQPLDQVIGELQQLRRGSLSGEKSPGAAACAAAHSLLTGRFQARAPGAADITVAEQEGNAVTPSLPAPATGSARLPDHSYYRSIAHLGQQTAQALAYAHSRGIVHRDIKPSNLLLDAAGVVWVTDFGLAHVEESDLTETGEVLGTVRYMAPERFRGACDPRSDLYALGLTLYELLALQPAFPYADRLQLMDAICYRDPPRLREVDAAIPRDLETIVLKAIDREPSRRYQTAEEMAEDLHRFLADEPIKARRVSLWERFARSCRRNPLVAGLTTAVVLLVAVVAVVSSVASYQRGRALEVSEDLRKQADAALWESLRDQARANRISRVPGQRFKTLHALQRALRFPVPPEHSLDELRNEAAAALCLPDLEVEREWQLDQNDLTAFAIDDAFRHYAYADRQGLVSLRRLSDHAEIARLPGVGPLDWYDTLLFAPNGRGLVQQCRTPAGWLTRLWRLQPAEPTLVLTVPNCICDFSHDGEQCALHDFQAGEIRIHEVHSGAQVRRFPYPHAPGMLRWHPQRPLLALTSSTGWRTLDAVTGKVVTEGRVADGCTRIAWHPEGRILAAVNETRRQITLHDARTGAAVLPPLEGHRHPGMVVRFNRAGDLLLSNDWSGMYRLWDVRSGKPWLNQSGHSSCLAFSPDDDLVGADVLGGQVRLHRLKRAPAFRTVPPAAAWQGGVFNGYASLPLAEGRLLAIGVGVGTRKDTVHQTALLDVARAELAGAIDWAGDLPLRMGSGGATLWTSSWRGLGCWPLRNKPDRAGTIRIGPPEIVWPAAQYHAFHSSADADVIAMPAYNKGTQLLQRSTNRRLTLGPHHDVRGCAVSPEGRWVVSGTFGYSAEAGAKVWDAATGKLERDLPVGGRCNVRFSPDGRWLGTSSDRLRIFEVGSWRVVADLRVVAGADFAFAPDSRTVAVMGELSTVRLIETHSGRELVVLTAPERTRLIPVSFTPDGTTLVTVGAESSAIHVFDLRELRQGLREVGLDWEAPPLPPVNQQYPEPLEIELDLGQGVPVLPARKP